MAGRTYANFLRMMELCDKVVGHTTLRPHTEYQLQRDLIREGYTREEVNEAIDCVWKLKEIHAFVDLCGSCHTYYYH